jgi:hypothetical protein
LFGCYDWLWTNRQPPERTFDRSFKRRRVLESERVHSVYEIQLAYHSAVKDTAQVIGEFAHGYRSIQTCFDGRHAPSFSTSNNCFQSDGMSLQQPFSTLTHYLHPKLVGDINSAWKKNLCVTKAS